MNNLFPTPLEDWVGSYRESHELKKKELFMFPAPLEVWVGSYRN